MYSNKINLFNNNYNSFYYDSDQIILQYILLDVSYNVYNNQTSSYVDTDNIVNYFYNNNYYDIVSDSSNKYNIIQSYSFESDTFINSTISSIIVNILLSFITKSINTISNIYNKNAYDIYLNNAGYTSIFEKYNESICIFPLTSSIFIYSESGITTNFINQRKNVNLYNLSQVQYLENIYNLVLNNCINEFTKYKINYNTNINFTIDNLFSSNIGKQFTNYISNYYNNNYTNINQIVYNNLNQYFIYLYNNMNTYSSIIYSYDASIIDLNDFILKNIFIYTDTYLFNSAFQSYQYTNSITNKLTDFISSKIYNKFIFLINSPLYRLYYLFTYLIFITQDPNFYKTMPGDLISLRDFLLKFILQLIYFLNNNDISNLNPNSNPDSQINLNNTNKYDFSYINNNLLISNLFLTYDSINIFENGSLFSTIAGENIEDSSSILSYIYIYSSFYF